MGVGVTVGTGSTTGSGVGVGMGAGTDDGVGVAAAARTVGMVTVVEVASSDGGWGLVGSTIRVAVVGSGEPGATVGEANINGISVGWSGSELQLSMMLIATAKVEIKKGRTKRLCFDRFIVVRLSVGIIDI